MLNVKNKVNFEYNSMYDILYIKLEETSDSYGDEEIRGIIINYDYDTDKIVGADIWGFKRRMKNHEVIKLPVDVDLDEIYNSL